MSWEKVEAEIFKFEKEGDSIEGEILSIEESTKFSNMNYQIKTDKTTNIIFGTSVMDTKMKRFKVGDKVKIIFTGVEKATTKGHNDLQLFDVYGWNE